MTTILAYHRQHLFDHCCKCSYDIQLCNGVPTSHSDSMLSQSASMLQDSTELNNFHHTEVLPILMLHFLFQSYTLAMIVMSGIFTFVMRVATPLAEISHVSL